MVAYSRSADLSVGYHETILLDAQVGDYTGWVFEATFAAFVGDPDGIALAMADDLASDGWFIVDGPGRLVSLKILPATLQGYPNTAGKFQLFTNILATPPDQERFHLADMTLTVQKGPTA
jgi:hypothetical protein